MFNPGRLTFEMIQLNQFQKIIKLNKSNVFSEQPVPAMGHYINSASRLQCKWLKKPLSTNIKLNLFPISHPLSG